LCGAPNKLVFVLTGLFRYVKNDVSRHAGEKVPGNLVLRMLGRLLYFRDVSMVLFLFSQFWALIHELPNSKETECEIDHIGIQLAAEAYYNPKATRWMFV